MNWYVIFTETGYEDYICLYINKMNANMHLDYKLLVPKRELVERKQGISKKVLRKIFPGYIFVQTDDIINFYYSFKTIQHIITFLKNSSCFLNVTCEEINRILSMVNNSGVINISQALLINDKIIITDGPLMGNEGILKKVNQRKGRAKVELLIGNNSVLVDVGINITKKM